MLEQPAEQATTRPAGDFRRILFPLSLLRGRQHWSFVGHLKLNPGGVEVSNHTVIWYVVRYGGLKNGAVNAWRVADDDLTAVAEILHAS